MKVLVKDRSISTSQGIFRNGDEVELPDAEVKKIMVMKPSAFEILKAENDFQKNVIQQHNLDQEELEFLRLNLIYSSKCQSKKLFSTGFKVGTEEYKECIMRKGKISD